MSLVTVLGASGYVGSHVANVLSSRGHDVFAPARGDQSIVSRPLGTVIYCIGLTGDYRTKPFATVEAHVGLLARVLEKADFTSLTYLSSTRVYLGAETAREETPLAIGMLDASSLYNLTKLTGESLCLASGRKTRVIRLSNVVGPGLDPASGNFVASLVNEAKTGRISLQSHPESAKDYIHIDTAAMRIADIALDGMHAVYNLASGQQRPHRDWINRIAALSGCAVSLDETAARTRFPPIDISRLTREFGPSPPLNDDWLTAEFAPLSHSLRG